MATRTWNKNRASKRIDGKIEVLPLKNIEIKEYVRDTDLTSLPANVAYRLDGVHLYADILNLSDMLRVKAPQSGQRTRQFWAAYTFSHRAPKIRDSSTGSGQTPARAEHLKIISHY